jgi:septation ring formation regulator EzrA
MARPSKSVVVLLSEKKSHRTKSEIKTREQAEKALFTGVAFKERPEVKDNQIAHKEFLRLNALFKSIGKNDALYEPVINRYCMLQAECLEFEEMREQFYQSKNELQEDYHENKGEEFSPSKYYKMLSDMQNNIISLDKQIQSKRKMMFDIERENAMSIQSALRSIPKQPDKAGSPLLEALKDDSAE